MARGEKKLPKYDDEDDAGYSQPDTMMSKGGSRLPLH
jgi:hypothetical protein